MAFRKEVNTDQTIVVGRNTYKIGFLIFIKNLSLVSAIICLLFVPFAPFMLIFTVYFGFMFLKYNKILKAPVPSKSSISTENFQNANSVHSSNYIDVFDQVLNIHLPSGKSARIKFFVTGTRHENRESLIKEFLRENAHNIDRPFLNMSDSEIIESNRTVYEYYYDNLNGPLRLEPEPDNKFDKNAIKVLLNDKLIGYVPANDCERVQKFINSNEYDLWWQIRGGVSKFYPGYGDKVSKEINEGGIQIKLFKK